MTKAQKTLLENQVAIISALCILLKDTNRTEAAARLYRVGEETAKMIGLDTRGPVVAKAESRAAT